MRGAGTRGARARERRIGTTPPGFLLVGVVVFKVRMIRITTATTTTITVTITSTTITMVTTPLKAAAV